MFYPYINSYNILYFDIQLYIIIYSYIIISINFLMSGNHIYLFLSNAYAEHYLKYIKSIKMLRI